MPLKWMRRLMLLAVMVGILLITSMGSGRVEAETPVEPAGQNLARVAAPYSDGPIGVQAGPSATIVAPSAAIGDFGASQGNVWDMDSTSDIVWTQPNASGQTIALSQPSQGIVRGRVPEGDDLAIAFYASSSNNLPASRYHHLTYRLKIAAEGDCRTNGRVIYAKAWPNWLGSQVYTYAYVPHSAPMNCGYGNYCIYYMDLSSNNNDIQGPDTATWFKDPPPWPTDPVKAFGLWAHERWVNCSGGPNYFDIDYAYLTGDIVAREKDGYRYTLKWNVADRDGGTITSELRYKEVPELLLPSEAPTCNSTNFTTAWTYIDRTTTDVSPIPSYPNKIYLPIVMVGGASGGTGAFNTTYNWDLSGSAFEDGLSYYVCIRVDDGTSQSYAVSSAPVLRVPHSPNFAGD
jgi:hypothetical protein